MATSRPVASSPPRPWARTLVDLGAGFPEYVVESAFVQARARRLVGWEAVAAEVEVVGRRGRRGTAAIRSVLGLHDPTGRPLDSVAETKVLRILRRHGVPEPICQHEVRAGDGALLARCDFFWRPSTAPEFLGYGPHSSRAQFERDRRRVRALEAAGIDVVEITWPDLSRNDEWIGQLLEQWRGRGAGAGRVSA